ncbi:MAG: thioesterase family protein [Chloroflexota bacterium]
MDAPPPIRPADSRVDARFRYVSRIEVRFRDLDALGHVNHVVYLSYVEQARTLYFQNVLGLTIPANWVIARVTCDYALPLRFAEVVDVGWRLTRLGRASAEYELVLMRGAEVVASGGGALVHVDPDTGRAAPIPDEMRALAAAWDGLEPLSARPG